MVKCTGFEGVADRRSALDSAGQKSAKADMYPAGALAAYGVCFALVVNSLVTGRVGIDYGQHWDEVILVEGLTNSIKDLSLLPRSYIYGGMYFNVGFLVLLPHTLRSLPAILREIAASPSRVLMPNQYPAIISDQARLISIVGGSSFLMQARMAFLIISMAACIWVFRILHMLFPKRPWGAVAGVGFMASSWEVAYHSRFIAPDAMLMQFGALTLLLTTEALLRRDALQVAGWLVAAAAAAGVTFGCKMPGVFMVIPVLTAALIHRDLSRDARSRLLMIVAIVSVFAFSFLVVQPGTALDPIRFVAEVIFVSSIYHKQYLAWAPYVVGRFADHGRWTLRWLLGAVPSPALALAAPMSIITMAGFRTLWLRHRDWFWCVSSFVLPYGAFVASTPLLVVRNWLVLIPITAIGFGAGALSAYDLIRRRGRAASWLVPIAVAGAFAYNVAWLWVSADSVRQTDPAVYTEHLWNYFAAHPQRDFRLSPGIVETFSLHPPREAVGHLLCTRDGNAPTDRASEVVLLAHEHPCVDWIANRPGFVKLTVSSLEVNYDYYPTWFGSNRDRRIVVLSADHAREMHVSLDGYRRCRLQP